jgi:hypothetical protein
MPSKRKRPTLVDPPPKKPPKKPAKKRAVKKKTDEPKTPRREYKYAYLTTQDDLTDDMIETLCEWLSKGRTLKNVIDLMCISADRIAVWRRRGEAFLLGEGEKNWEIYARLLVGMRFALGEYGMREDKKIHTAKDWFRHLQIMSRKDPDTYGMNPRGGADEDYHADDKFL